MGQGFDGLVDFTGLSTAQAPPPPPPATPVGFEGFVDFTGLAVGQVLPGPAPAIPVGFVDYFALGGLFVGQGSAIVPPIPVRKGHGGFRGAGRYIDLILAQERQRRLRELKVQLPVLREQLWQKLMHQGASKLRLHEKRLTESAMYSTLLAEI